METALQVAHFIPEHTGIYTDFLAITMVQGYVLTIMADKPRLS
jgi:hypothetical protein